MTADGRPKTEADLYAAVNGRPSPVVFQMGMRLGTEMPSLTGATEWFGGTQAHAEAETRGKPTLIHFWSLSCGVCKDNMPRIAEWRDELRERGLRVVAIHLPRYEADTNIDEVREAIATNSINEPCAIDNEHKLKDAFQNDQGFVPAYYLFDGEGKLRGFAAGERGLDLLKATLERVLTAYNQNADVVAQAS